MQFGEFKILDAWNPLSSKSRDFAFDDQDRGSLAGGRRDEKLESRHIMNTQ
jgi:hypothetical protein